VGEVVADPQRTVRDAGRPRRCGLAQQQTLEVDVPPKSGFRQQITVRGRDDGSIPNVIAQEQRSLGLVVELPACHSTASHAVAAFVATFVRFAYDELHIPGRLRGERQKGPLAKTASLVLGPLHGLGRHAAKTADQPTARRKVEPPVEAAGAAADAVVLAAAHENQQGKLETLAVCPRLVGVADFRRSPQIEMSGLERGSPVRHVDGARAVATFRVKAYVAQPFLRVVGTDPKHLVDDLGPSIRRLLIAENAKIPFDKSERSDDAISPKQGRYIRKCVIH